MARTAGNSGTPVSAGWPDPLVAHPSDAGGPIVLGIELAESAACARATRAHGVFQPCGRSRAVPQRRGSQAALELSPRRFGRRRQLFASKPIA
jgi:hypothetical protein